MHGVVARFSTTGESITLTEISVLIFHLMQMRIQPHFLITLNSIYVFGWDVPK